MTYWQLKYLWFRKALYKQDKNENKHFINTLILFKFTSTVIENAFIYEFEFLGETSVMKRFCDKDMVKQSEFKVPIGDSPIYQT